MTSIASRIPTGRLAISTHSSRVWQPSAVTTPMQLAGMPSDSGILQSVDEDGGAAFDRPDIICRLRSRLIRNRDLVDAVNDPGQIPDRVPVPEGSVGVAALGPHSHAVPVRADRVRHDVTQARPVE